MGLFRSNNVREEKEKRSEMRGRDNRVYDYNKEFFYVL
jgi:hypothetical protein